MKVFIVALVAFAAVVYAVPVEETQYTTKYDNIDVDKILSNSRATKQYVDCILRTDLNDRKGCPGEAFELRSRLDDAITTKCAKCSDKQKEQAKHVINTLMKTQPEQWSRLKERYDPTGELTKQYSSELN